MWNIYFLIALYLPFSLSKLSALIPPSLIFAVAEHRCEPRFLSVPLDSAHLHRFNALRVLIRLE